MDTVVLILHMLLSALQGSRIQPGTCRQGHARCNSFWLRINSVSTPGDQTMEQRLIFMSLTAVINV